MQCQVDYARSGRTACDYCNQKILEGELRLCNRTTSSWNAHVCCLELVTNRKDAIPMTKVMGFGGVAKEHQALLLACERGELKGQLQLRGAVMNPKAAGGASKAAAAAKAKTAKAPAAGKKKAAAASFGKGVRKE